MSVSTVGRRTAYLSCQRLPNRIVGSFRQPRVRSLRTEARPAVEEDMLGTVYNMPPLDDMRKIEGDVSSLPFHLVRTQLDLHSPVDLLREVLLQNLAPDLRHNHIRHPVHQALSTPQHTTVVTPDQTPPFPLSGDPLPHPIFRDALNSRPGIKEVRRIMREQLLRCQRPRDILRVMAVAMQRKETSRELSRMQESLRRALYRIRNNATDADVLKTINVIVMRFQAANLHVPVELSKLGLKFAARARSLPGMKRHLKQFKLSGETMSRSVFRSIIAKFSIGTRGLGEIRNGRWRRKELLQVLLGFEDTPSEEAHHLGIFLVRDDWQFFHGWLTVLARCKAVDQLWKEWEYWLECSPRKNPRKLQVDYDMTTKVRGDYWFVEQMAYAGDLEKAWAMLKVSGITFANVRPAVRSILLEGAQYATVPDAELEKELLMKYANDLKRIEDALGVKWIGQKDGDGYHIVQGNMEDTLESLASPDFVFVADHGFPWDEPSAKERDDERMMMEAEEQNALS